MGSKYLDRVDNKALGQLLVEKGALSEQQVNEALEVSRRKGIRLGEALVSLGYIGGDALSYAIAEQYGQRPMELHPSMVDEDLVRRFDWNLLWQHAMLPLIELDNELVVVVGDPNDQTGLDALARLSPGKDITPQLGATGQIQRCLDSFRPADANPRGTANVSRGSGSRNPANAEAAMLVLPELQGAAPAPASPQFDEWLLSVAAAHWGQDVLVRKFGDDLTVSLAPAAVSGPGDETPAAASPGLTELGRWPRRAPVDAVDGLLRECVTVSHTRGQVCHVSQPRQYQGSSYDFLIINPIAPGPEFARIRALRHLDHNIDPVLAAKVAELPAPGRCTVVEYGPLLRLDRLIQQMVAHVHNSQQLLVLAANLRTALAGVAVYPLPFVDAASAAQAHGATALVFDSPPAPGVIDRIFLTASPLPAVIIFTPSGAREALDAIITRPGTCHVKIESHPPHDSDSSSNSSKQENL